MLYFFDIIFLVMKCQPRSLMFISCDEMSTTVIDVICPVLKCGIYLV